MKRKEYNPGDIIGDYGVIFKEEVASHGKKRYGVFLCPYDGTEFTTSISNITTGHTRSCGCAVKESLSKRRRQDLVGKKFGQLTVVKFSHINSRGKYVWECFCDCGNPRPVYTTTSDLNIGNSQRCSLCSYKIIGEKEAIDFTGQTFGELTVLYKTNKRDKWGSVIWHCRCSCSNELDVSASQIRNKTSCGCKHIKSLGEEKIRALFDKHGVKYKYQYCFDDCKNPDTGYALPFDFYLPDYNQCIEYDGEQHYFGWHRDEKSLKGIQYRDKIKTDWCQINKVSLLRIPYYEYENIESILTDFIKGGIDQCLQ